MGPCCGNRRFSAGFEGATNESATDVRRDGGLTGPEGGSGSVACSHAGAGLAKVGRWTGAGWRCGSGLEESRASRGSPVKIDGGSIMKSRWRRTRAGSHASARAPSRLLRLKAEQRERRLKWAWSRLARLASASLEETAQQGCRVRGRAR